MIITTLQAYLLGLFTPFILFGIFVLSFFAWKLFLMHIVKFLRHYVDDYGKKGEGDGVITKIFWKFYRVENFPKWKRQYIFLCLDWDDRKEGEKVEHLRISNKFSYIYKK